MTNLSKGIMALAAALQPGSGSPDGALAQPKELVIGDQCDRTGPTQIVGTVLCPAMQDYYKLVNAEGGVDGWTIRGDEIDNQYKVPQGIEAYERQKQMGVVMMTLYGTPQTVALNQRLEQDKMPTTSPGFGIAAAADGARYPYLFPIAATYWSQAAGAVKFAKDKLGGSLKGKKIAYVYYDNPAGKEPMPILDALQKQEGFELRTFAVPPPGVEMGAQMLDITQRYHPDFVIDASVRPLALGGDQGDEGRRLPAVQGHRPGVGLGRGRHPGGRRLGRRRGLQHPAIRRRRRRLSGAPANQGDVQKGR